MKILSTFVAAFFAVSSAEMVRYDNYTVYKLTPKTQAAVDALHNWEHHHHADFNFWSPIKAVGDKVDVMVPPHQKLFLEQFSALNEIDNELMIENVQDIIDKEVSTRSLRDDTFGWNQYHTLDEVRYT